MDVGNLDGNTLLLCGGLAALGGDVDGGGDHDGAAGLLVLRHRVAHLLEGRLTWLHDGHRAWYLGTSRKTIKQVIIRKGSNL